MYCESCYRAICVEHIHNDCIITINNRTTNLGHHKPISYIPATVCLVEL